MTAHETVDVLLECNGIGCRTLGEASVHLPHHGSIWVAAYRDETGRPRFRTTGLRDKAAALAVAREWEAEAPRKREAQGPVPPKPTVRVRAGSPELAVGLRGQAEVARE